MWTLNYGSLGNDLCISVGVHSLQPPHPLCTDIRYDSQAYTEGDGHIVPFLIIFHWLAGCRLYHSWAQLLYLMVRVLDHSIHLNHVSFQIVLTED